MPKFISPRDVSFFRRISRELVDVVIQNTLVLFKVNLNETKVNLYGESVNKTWHLGVELFCLIEMDPENMQYEGFGPDNTQNMVFRLDRDMCSEKNSYPEVGDIIYFNLNDDYNGDYKLTIVSLFRPNEEQIFTMNLCDNINFFIFYNF